MEDVKPVKKRNPTQKISSENMERIANVGKFGESVDDVIGRLLDYWEHGHKQEKKK